MSHEKKTMIGWSTPYRPPQPQPQQPQPEPQLPPYLQHQYEQQQQYYQQLQQQQHIDQIQQQYAQQHAPHYPYPVHQPAPYPNPLLPQHVQAGHAAMGQLVREQQSSDKLRAKANATAGVSNRLRFIRLTYVHLLFAILAFAGLEYLLMTNEFLVDKISVPFVRFALGGRWNWGVVLAVFMAVSWIADYWASHASSRAAQYIGLGVYVIAEAVIFVPLLAIVAYKTQAILARGGEHPNIIRDSAYVTLAIFSGLTLSVFLSKKDFSFLRSGLLMASSAALAAIVLALTFGFNLGLVFSVAMVVLAAGYILYQTSQVLAHYDTHQHVAASLALFSSVALMFWYVIRIFLRARE